MSRTDKDAPLKLQQERYEYRWEVPAPYRTTYWYKYWTHGVPKWYINHVWNAPERLSSRVDCNEAKKEFNAGYEPETEPSTRQHRHCAQWLYW